MGTDFQLGGEQVEDVALELGKVVVKSLLYRAVVGDQAVSADVLKEFE